MGSGGDGCVQQAASISSVAQWQPPTDSDENNDSTDSKDFSSYSDQSLLYAQILEPSPTNKKLDISVCPGLLVTEDVVAVAMKSKLRVQTTKLYLKRLGDNKFDSSQGRVGIITGVNNTPEGSLLLQFFCLY